MQDACNKNYNCTYYVTNFSVSDSKFCVLATYNHEYFANTTVPVYINKHNQNCAVDFSDTVKIVPLFGVMLLSLAALDVCAIVVMLFIMAKQKYNINSYRTLFISDVNPNILSYGRV